MTAPTPDAWSASRPWDGTVFIGAGWLLYSGAVGQATLHAHHAIQVLVARSGVGHVTDGHGGACRGAVVQVAANAAHALPCALPSAHLLYLEAGSRAARRVDPPRSAALRAFAPTADTLAPLARAPEPDTLEGAARLASGIVALIAHGARTDRPRPRHPSVRQALARLPDLIAEHGSALRLPRIAAAVGRAPDGLSRSFNAEVGMSLPAYIRWARLRLVAHALARGRTLTSAAQDAGFSDSAHLSRVFRGTFGIRPSDLATRVRWLVGDVALD